MPRYGIKTKKNRFGSRSVPLKTSRYFLFLYVYFVLTFILMNNTRFLNFYLVERLIGQVCALCMFNV